MVTLHHFHQNTVLYMHIPFIDLYKQYQSIKNEIDTVIQRILTSGQFASDEEVECFEIEFAKYLNVNHCISVNSGTDALILGTRSLNLKPGEEVLIPSNTFIATALAATENGLKPVFVDTDENDYGINLDDLKRKLNKRTKAVILVHLYGQPDKIDEVKELIRKTGKHIYLIEDACQAHGAEYKGKKVGTFGSFAAFSFYPTKNLGAYGDGGVIVTSDDKVAQRCRLLKDYGQSNRYYHQSRGVNSRLDTLQAAILRIKLKYLDKWNIKRSELASLYTKLLNHKVPSLQTPRSFPERKSVYHLYVVKANKRDALRAHLAKHTITSFIHYPLPLHLQKIFLNLGYKKGDLPMAEKFSSEILSLPLYPELSLQQLEHIVEVISNFYRAS